MFLAYSLRHAVIVTLLLATTVAGAGEVPAELRRELSRLPGGRLAGNWTLIPMAGLSTEETDGVNYAPSDGSTVSTTERIAPTGGLLIEYGRGVFTFQSGVYYLQEGFERLARTKVGSGMTTRSVGVNVGYVGVPLLGKLNLRTNRATYYLKAGVIPVYAANIESKEEPATVGTLATGGTANQKSAWAEESIRSSNIIGQGGVGIAFSLIPTFSLQLEGTYNRTLQPVNESPSGNQDDEFTASSYGILFGFGISL